MSPITKDSLIREVKGYGLEDPEVLEVMKFTGKDDFLKAVYPGRSPVLAADADLYLDDLLGEAAARASLARRLEYRGVSPGLGDALWAAQQTRRKAQEAFAGDLAASGPVGSARSSGAGCEWRPHKRVRRAAGMGEADRLLMKKWGSRLAALLEGG